MTKSGTAFDWLRFSGGYYKSSDKTCLIPEIAFVGTPS
jgi:hypothetical protein